MISVECNDEDKRVWRKKGRAVRCRRVQGPAARERGEKRTSSEMQETPGPASKKSWRKKDEQ